MKKVVEAPREVLVNCFRDFFALVIYIFENDLFSEDVNVMIARINKQEISLFSWIESTKRLGSFCQSILHVGFELKGISKTRSGDLVIHALSGEMYRFDIKNVEHNFRNIYRGKIMPHARTIGVLYWLFCILSSNYTNGLGKKTTHYHMLVKLFHTTLAYRDLLILDKQVINPRQFMINFLGRHRLADKALKNDKKQLQAKQTKVLLIDDDPVMNVFMRSILEGSDYNLLISYNMSDAFDIIIKNKRAFGLLPNYIQCILLDFQLHGIDGFEFLKYLKQVESPFYKIPIIIITGSSDYQFVKKQVAQKYDNVLECLKKPINKERILALLSLVSSKRNLKTSSR